MKSKLLATVAVFGTLFAGSAFATGIEIGGDASADADAEAVAVASNSVDVFNENILNVTFNLPWYGGHASQTNEALAYTDQSGGVWGNGAVDAVTYDANSIVSSFGEATGVVHAGQNAGANSNVQANSTIAAILGCECDDVKSNLAVADTDQYGGVAHNFSFSLASASANSINNSFGTFTGLAQVQQNTGNNSLMQSNATVAAIVAD